MDPTTVALPSSPKKSPPSPPQNPHTPTGAVTEASAFDCFQKGDPPTPRNMENFKSLVFRVAGRLLPAHRSQIKRQFSDMFRNELLVPSHPPYADMILNALWELKAEGGSSEEAISDYIEKEYHELPWAHATILKHHLTNLCMKGKITMTNDSCYALSSSLTNLERSPSSSPCSSPVSSAYSSSSASFCTSPSSSRSSPSSSSSSMRWRGCYRRRKKKNIKRKRGKKVQGRDRSTRRFRGRVRVDVEEGDDVEEPTQGTEDENEVTVIEDEDYSAKVEDVPDVIVMSSEEENLPCEENKVEEHKQETKDENDVTVMEDEDCSIKDGDVPDVIAKSIEEDNKEEHLPQRKRNVTWIGRRVLKLEEAESDSVDVQADDVSEASVDEHVEQVEPIEHIEENQQPDILGERAFEDEQRMDDEKNEPNKQLDHLTKEQVETQEQSADLQHDYDDATAAVDDGSDGVTEDPVHPQEQCDEKTEESHESCKQDQMNSAEAGDGDGNGDGISEEPIHPQEKCDEKTEESLESFKHDQMNNAEAADGHANDDDDDGDGHDDGDDNGDGDGDGDGVTDDPVHPQEQCDEKTEESLESCKQDQMNNAEADSAEHEEQQTEVNPEESVSDEVEQEPFEINEKESFQENTNPACQENKISSSSTVKESKPQPRQGLRSSTKKEDATPNPKKQLELVTPVRRTLRSHKSSSEAATITEVSDHSKDEVTHSGRTRSSKRKVAEAEQASDARKTRRSGLCS